MTSTSIGSYNGFQNLEEEFEGNQSAVNSAESAIKTAESWIPTNVRTVIQSGGYTKFLADDKNQTPGPNQTWGSIYYCHDSKKDFEVSGIGSLGTPLTTQSQPAAFVPMHEMGHALDDMLGEQVGTNYFSQSSNFQSDTSTVGNPNLFAGDYSGYAPTTQSGSQQLVADIVAAQAAIAHGFEDSTADLAGVPLSQLITHFQKLSDDITNQTNAAAAAIKAGTFKGRRAWDSPMAPDHYQSFLQVQQAPSVTPLVIELSNDAVHTTSLNDGVNLDMENTGFSHPVAWVGQNDGILVLNNNNGVFTNGNQLFGSNTPLANGQLALNGFAALAQYDVNNAGQISAADPVWTELGVLMGNGELLSLNDVGISAINLSNSTVNQFDANGNEETLAGSFVYSNDTVGTIADFNLLENPTDSDYTSPVALSNAVLALPDASGSGTVMDLQQAVQQDNSGVLMNAVQQFQAATDPTSQGNLLNQLIYDWTGVTGVAQNANGPNISGQEYAALEKFYGQTFTFPVPFNNSTPMPGPNQSMQLNELYANISQSIYGQLEFSSNVNDLANLMVNAATEDLNTGEYYYDLTPVANSLVLQDQTDHNDAAARLNEFIGGLEGYQLVTQTNFQTFENDIVQAAPDLASVFNSSPELTFSQSNTSFFLNYDPNIEVATVTGNNDGLILPVGTINAVLEGINDTVYGALGTDTFSINSNLAYAISGNANTNFDVNVAGNDGLYGGFGNDTYNLVNGFGNVNVQEGTLNFLVPNDVSTDTVNFGAGVNANSLVATASGSNLILSFGSSGTLTLDNILEANGLYKEISNFNFASGPSDTLTQLVPNKLADTITASNNSYLFQQSPIGINATIASSATNDELTFGSLDGPISDAGSGNVITLDGTATIVSITGNDETYDGVAANDVITDAGSHNVFNIANGGGGTITVGANDTIYGSPTEIKLGTGSTQSNVTYSLNSQDGLVIGLPSANQITLDGIFSDNGTSTTVLFGDGTSKTISQLLQGHSFTITNSENGVLVDRSSSPVNETINNSGNSDTIVLGSGNDVVADAGSSNTIHEGSGPDSITVGKNDTILTNSNNSTIVVDENSGLTTYGYTVGLSGSDTLSFGSGITEAGVTATSGGVDNEDAILTLDSNGDKIDIIGAFALGNPNQKITTLQFSNGSHETLASILSAPQNLTNSASNTTVSYTSYNNNLDITNNGSTDTIDLGGGNDVVTENGSNDTFFGSNGAAFYTLSAETTNDTINTSAGATSIVDDGHNNTVWGNNGALSVTAGTDDTLNGNNGTYFYTLGTNDAAFSAGGVFNYIYNAGTGAEQISEGATPVVSGTTDTLTFGSGLTENDLSVLTSFNDVIITDDVNSNDSVELFNELNQAPGAKVINSFNFADGTQLNLSQLATLPIVLNQSNYEEDLYGNNINNTVTNNGDNNQMYLSDGTDTVTENGSNDEISFGAGVSTGTLSATTNNDGISFNNGNVTVTDNGYDNNYFAGSGNSQITLTSTSQNDGITFGSGNLTVINNGDDTNFFLSNGNATIQAGANDNVNGGSGNADLTLSNNDYFYSDGGLTTVNYNSGSGTVNLFEGAAPTTAGTSDTLNLGPYINEGNIYLLPTNNDLYITDGNNTADEIYIANEFNQGSNEVVGTFNFADGTSLTLQQLMALPIVNDTNSSGISYAGNTLSENNVNNGSNDSITLSGGNDVITENGHQDSFTAGSGNDTFTLSSATFNDSLHLSTGAEIVTDNGHNDTITAGTGSLQLTLSASTTNDHVTIGSGSIIDQGHQNVITLGSGTATLTAGANDTITGGAGTATALLGQNDSFTSKGGVDHYTFNSGTGPVLLTEGATPTTNGTVDTLALENGILQSNFSYRTTNNDLYIMDSLNPNDVIHLATELNQGTKKVVNTFTFSDNSTLTLSQLLALPEVNSANNSTVSYAGNTLSEAFINNGINDTLTESGGNDTFTDNGHNDKINAGAGTTDTFTLSASTTNDTVTLSTGNDTITDNGSSNTVTAGTGAAHATLSSATTNDTVTLAGGNDSITDNGHANKLNGGAGPSTITLGSTAYNDTVVFHAGNDTVSDAGHNDTFTLSSGVSTITAGKNDIITGGSGNASIAFATNDSVTTAGGIDAFTYAKGTGYVSSTEGATPTTAGAIDTITFGAGISENSIILTTTGNNFELNLNDGVANDAVYLVKELNQGTKKVVNKFTFSDGTSLTLAQLQSRDSGNAIHALTPAATAGNALPDSDTSSANSVSSSSNTTSVDAGAPSSSVSSAGSGSSSSTPNLASSPSSSTDQTSPNIASSDTDGDSSNSTSPSLASTSGSSSSSSSPSNSSSQPGDPNQGSDNLLGAPNTFASSSSPPQSNSGDAVSNSQASANNAPQWHHGVAFNEGGDVFASIQQAMQLFESGNSGEPSISKHQSNVVGLKTDPSLTADKLQKYELETGKFLSGAELSLVLQNIAAFAPDHSHGMETSLAKHQHVETPLLAVAHH